MKLSNNKILITGGATGIGLGLADRFIAEGNTVIVCGRRASALDEAKDTFPSLITYQCDLANEVERHSLFTWISGEHSDTNVLINNAGIQQWVSVTDNDFFKKAENEIETNIEAPIHLNSLFLNLKSLDTIINVTSGLAFVPLVKIPIYCATKAFLRSYTLSLRELLKPSNIEVIEMLPPALNTDLGGKGIHDHAPPVSGFIDSVFEQLKLGKTEITYGMSEMMVNAGPAEQKQAFERMNGVNL